MARRRQVSQRLLGSTLGTSADVVAWLGGVQAQDYAGAKWALGIRAPGLTDADVEGAFASGAILRTHVLRPTWHFVTPADIRWMLALTAPRVHAANAYMYRKLELDSETFRRCDAVLTRALQGGQQLTRDELREAFRSARILPDGELRMGYLMMRAELDGLVCSGARRGNQFTYALLDERVPPTPSLNREDALGSLAHWFFTSRGPATIHDFSKWSGLTVADARNGLSAIEATLETEHVDGKAYWSAAASVPLTVRGSTAHLLSIYDEYVSGYKDRSAIVSATNGTQLMAMGNALTSIVVVNGQIRGTWKRRIDKRTVEITIAMFDRLTKAEDRAVNAALEEYGTFVGKTVVRG